MKKRRLRRTIGILTAVAISTVAVFCLLLTPPAKRLAFNYFCRYLEKTAGIRVETASVRLGYFHGRAVFENLTVRSSAASCMPPLFRANHVDIDLDIKKVLRGKIAIEKITIAGLEIYYYADNDGNDNVPILPSSGDGSAPDILIASAAIRDGVFRYDDLSKNLFIKIPELNIDVTGDAQTLLHHIVFENQADADLMHEDVSLSAGTLRFIGNLDLKNNSFEISSSRFSADGFSADITGSVNYSAPSMDLTINATVDLPRASALASLREPLGGNLSGEIHAVGNFESLDILTRIGITNFGFYSYRQNALELALNGNWRNDSKRLVFPQIVVSSSEGNISGKADLAVPGTSGTNFVAAEIKNINLSPLIKLTGTPFDIASHADGTVGIKWEGDFNLDKAEADARITLAADIAEPGAGIFPINGSFSASLKNNQLEVTIPELRALDIETSGRLALEKFKNIEGEFTGANTDIGLTIQQIAHLLNVDDFPAAAGGLSGAASFHIKAGGNLENPEISASLETPDLTFRKLTISANSDFIFRSDTLDFTSEFGLPENSAAVVKGRLNFSGEDAIVSIEADAKRVPATILNDVLNLQIPLSGHVDAAFDISGAIHNPEGSAVVYTSDLSFYEMPLGQLDAELAFSNREIHSEKFLLRRNPENLESFGNALEARFSYSLDSGRFGLRADGIDMTLGDWNLHERIRVPEKINFQISGEGTIDDPRIYAQIDTEDMRVSTDDEETSLGPVFITAGIISKNANISARAPRLNLYAEALGGLYAPYPFTAELHAENSDISVIGLKPQDGQRLGGEINAVIRASGNMQNPEQVEIDADIQNLALRVQDKQAWLFSPAKLLFRDRVLEIPNPALLVTRGSQLELSGRVPIGETDLEETLKLNGRVDLAEVLSFAFTKEELGVDGVISLNGTVNVLNGVFSGAGEIAMERGVVNIPGLPLPFRAVNIKAAVQDGALILRDASAVWGDGTIAISGELPFSALPWKIPGLVAYDSPVQFKIAVTGLTPEMTGIFPSALTGKVSFHAAGNADQADLESLRAEIIFDDLNFKVESLEFYQLEPSRIEIADGSAIISQLSIIGPETNLRMSGSAGILHSDAPIDLRLEGFLDAAILTFGDPDLRAAGQFDIQAAAGGTLSEPALSGYAETSNARFSLRTPRIEAYDLNIRLALNPEKISIEHITGLLNGGNLTGDGSLGYSRGLLGDINLRLSFNNFSLEAPKGLKSASSGTITITSKEDAIEIGGNVRIDESAFRESIEVGGQMLNYLRSQQAQANSDLTPDSILDRIRYNISVRTITPLRVQNNIARVDAEASGLRVVGTYNEPSVIGRVTLIEDGTIFLNQREFSIDRGVITFVNQNRVEPELDIQARTKVAGYDITLQLAGNPDRLSYVFSSDPPMPELDVVSLLLYGRTTSETQGREMQVMQSQALSLLAEFSGEQLTGGARRALHLSTFRIDPGFIASESDPGARLTIGEDITRDFSLAYSMNLINGGDQIWAAQYAVTRRFTTQTTKQYDNSYRFEFRHDMRFGSVNTGRSAARSGSGGRSGDAGAARTGARNNSRLEIGAIRFKGEENFSESALHKRLNASPGDRYDFSKIQKGVDRLQEFYFREKYLEADIRMRRETREDTVDIELSIASGPMVDFNFEGFPISSNTRRDVEKAWTEGVFEAGRVEDAVAVLRRAMTRDGYLEAEISTKIENAAKNGQPVGERRVNFHITPGTRYSGVTLRFPGATEISDDELRDTIKKAGLEIDVYADPATVADFIQRYYRERGYLEARAAATRLNLDPVARSGEAFMDIHEGPLFIIGDLEFTGASAFSYNRLWMVIPTSSGSFYNPEALRNSRREIENLYHSHGYNDVSTTFSEMRDASNALTHLTFQITERRQSFIEVIEIEGNQRNSLDFVMRQLDFQKGDVLDFEKINESRRRLYATGVYSTVDFQTEEITDGNDNEGRKNMRVRLRLRENAPYRFQYGLYYDTERGPGGIAEIQNINVMGRASNLGFRLRYDADLQEGRLYYRQPFIRALHLKMDVSAFAQNEERSFIDENGQKQTLFSVNRIGFSLTQERNIPRSFRLDYGYRYDHVNWTPENAVLDPTIFQANVPVARIFTTLTRDTRDNVLDATKGEFSAHTLEFGPSWLGSETGFARYSGQYFRYVPLDKFLRLSTKDRDGNALPARLVYAGALRLGLTSSFENREIISPERFFAGGGTTIRGFEQDMLGEKDEWVGSDGKMKLRPKGGEGLFLLNSEIRFPIWSVLHGVAFLDVGNVYTRLGDFDFSLRKTAGVGLRLKIFAPLRFDYGFKLDRKPGERGKAFFFSIGQAY